MGGADIAFYVGDFRNAYIKSDVCATRVADSIRQ